MKRTILITGGAGFIGSNVANFYIKKGALVVIFDNLSRQGANKNLAWLKKQGKFLFIKDDIRNYKTLANIFQKYEIDVVFHFAAQVAVTTSVANPQEDFDINALGTFNLLEAIRNFSPKSILLYSSTNKVYGDLGGLDMVEKKLRYGFRGLKFKNGISENQLLDFHSPYGCSKGAADQYVRDYARIYGLKTIVFRQSCIYGWRQIGLEDQGWVAWFSIRAILGKSVTVYGNGKQVRDVLFIDDLINAYDLAVKNIKKTAGKIYNIGGGAENSLSLLETFLILERLSGKKMNYKFSKWRPGDQKIFVSDNSLAKKDFDWEPKIAVQEGVKKLFNWLKENKKLFEN
jgi:CDP-paratose 2-epimerase